MLLIKYNNEIKLKPSANELDIVQKKAKKIDDRPEAGFGAVVLLVPCEEETARGKPRPRIGHPAPGKKDTIFSIRGRGGQFSGPSGFGGAPRSTG